MKKQIKIAEKRIQELIKSDNLKKLSEKEEKTITSILKDMCKLYIDTKTYDANNKNLLEGLYHKIDLILKKS